MPAMPKLPPNRSPEAFLADVFGTRLARDGKVIRRSAQDIERYFGREAFIEEIHRRGYRAIENAGHIVIFCNREPVRIIRRRSSR
jgi:hypothetical protein